LLEANSSEFNQILIGLHEILSAAGSECERFEDAMPLAPRCVNGFTLVPGPTQNRGQLCAKSASYRHPARAGRRLADETEQATPGQRAA
jgi:hypothetical protein